ncbi:MAG TPA: nucleotidyltransferase [Terriglobales bacterium]|nr:nucleotidyltransferase [Terriglobales bacterium]
MPIPLSKLDTWAHQGGTTASSAAYASIRHALLKSTSPLAGRDVDIFLQGSYGNSTNIYGDSDVDVVVLYGDTFGRDLSRLPLAQQQLHELLFPPATYRWEDLRKDVFSALHSHYGSSAVRFGSKSIKVDTGTGHRTSDVVPAVRFRRYATFTDRNKYTGHWGILFFDLANNPIVNYPKYHIERGEDKNQAARTAGQYKATVRIFKNLRNHLTDHGLLGDSVAPSYYIECALHNVPDGLFVGQFSTAVPAILNYLLYTPYAGFLAQNGVTTLIGNGPTQWSANDFSTFVVAAQSGWDNWN